MYFLITPRRRQGVALSAAELRDMKPIKGDVNIHECKDDDLGRYTNVAHVMNFGSGPDIIPRLVDAKVTNLATHGMNITGVEKVGDAYYFQSWWCRFE